ncbi:MAG: hypothetical protein ACRELF_11300 [Gemmataceae bacterium]
MSNPLESMDERTFVAAIVLAVMVNGWYDLDNPESRRRMARMAWTIADEFLALGDAGPTPPGVPASDPAVIVAPF